MTNTPASPTVAVLDYLGSETTTSLVSALVNAGADAFATTDPDKAVQASGLVLPGRASFADAAAAIKRIKGDRIVGQRLAGGRALLAVGTGMHVLFDDAVTGSRTTPGLGEWPGQVVEAAFEAGKYPVVAADGSKLLAGIVGDVFFDAPQAVKSFPLAEDDFIAYPKLSWADINGERILAAVENGPLWAMAFDPAMSGEVGVSVLGNWVQQLQPEVSHA